MLREGMEEVFNGASLKYSRGFMPVEQLRIKNEELRILNSKF